MTQQIVVRHPSAVNRRKPLVAVNKSPSSSSALSSSSRAAGIGGVSMRFGEVAGGTAAECAAVCCCCPCTVVKLLVLTVYKLPVELCRKALRLKRRRQLMKKGLLRQRSNHCDDTELQIHPIAGNLSAPATEKLLKSLQFQTHTDKDVLQLEKEMWDRFYGTGFWRNPSQGSNS